MPGAGPGGCTWPYSVATVAIPIHPTGAGATWALFVAAGAIAGFPRQRSAFSDMHTCTWQQPLFREITIFCSVLDGNRGLLFAGSAGEKQ